MLPGFKKDVKEQYGVTLTKIRAIGFSAMMHGYLAFDKAGELLVPFRTWRNTITEEAAAALTKEFSYNIPQRWSIAHLYQAMLNKEEHVKDIAFFTDSKLTLANFMRTHLYSSLATLKYGMDIMFKEENVSLDKLMGHGGFFKTKGVGQRIMAAAADVPVAVMETAGEGGAWGIALLAAYRKDRKEGKAFLII